MKEGILYFDRASERYDILFDNGSYYGNLHCGNVFDVLQSNEWKKTRIEFSDAWYLVGWNKNGKHLPLDGLRVRI